MKKFISAILCVSIVLTMSLSMVVTVSADYTSIESDNFEDSGEIVTTNYASSYVSNNGLLVHWGDLVPDSSWTSNHLSLEENKGYNGTTALYLHTDTDIMSGALYRQATVQTKGVVIGENEELIVRYKVKVKQIGAPYVPMPGISGKNGEAPSTSRTIALAYSWSGFDPDKWYTIVAKISGATATKSVDYYAVCEDGTIFDKISKNVTIGVDTTNYTEATQPIHIWPVYIPTAGGKDESDQSHIYMDDFYMAKVSTLSNQNISLDAAASTISDGAEDVLLTPTFRLVFDHSVEEGTLDTVKLYKKSDTNKQNPIACSISAKTFDGFTLKPSNKLDVNEDYVIDISGVSSTNGQVFVEEEKSIGFSTIKELPSEPVTFTGAAATKGGSFTEGNLTNVELDDSFTLTFDKPLSQPDASRDIVLYKSADVNKTGVSISATLSTDKKSVTVKPSSALSLNTEYTLSFEGVTSEEYGVLSGTKQVTFSTVVTRAAICLAEDFDNATGQINVYDSDILDETSGSYTFDSTGYGKTTAVRLNSVVTNNNVNLMDTKGYSLDASEKIAFEFKLNVKSYTDLADIGHSMALGVGNDGDLSTGTGFADTIFGIQRGENGPYIGHASTSQQLVLDPNVFYTIVIVSTTTSQTGYVYDEEGTLVYTRSIPNLTTPINGAARFVCGTTGARQVRADVTFDDFKVYRIHNHTLNIDSARSSVTDGAKDVNMGGAIKLAFNQPLAEGAAEKVSLYLGDQKLNATAEHMGGSEIAITPIDALSPGRTYKIKIDNPQSLFGQAYDGPASISFTTKTIYNINALGAALTVADGAVSAGEKTVTLDNLGDTVSDAVLVVAIYSDSRPARLIGWEMFDADVAAGESTVTVTLANNYQNAGSAEILLYNSMASLKPLMKSYKISQ